MRKIVFLLCVVALLGWLGVDTYQKWTAPPPPPRIVDSAVTRGDIVATVTATGPIGAQRTVSVGAQVTGIVKKLYVDYNSIVKAGEVIAEIDPSLPQQQLTSDEAALDRANISLAEDQATMANDKRNFERTDALFTKSLETAQDRELAQLTVKQDQAQIDQDNESIKNANIVVEKDKTNLSYCTIRSPIDGVVISRAVDEGTTVQASIAAPTLYVLATNLTTLQIEADVDEAEIGQVRPGQDVGITVDAYPMDTFHGSVTAARLNTTTINNVVTYQVMITAPNPDLRLRPGMTATLKISTMSVKNVLRVPNAATRFRTTPDMFTALKQPVPASVAAQAAQPAQAPGPALANKLTAAQIAALPRNGTTIDALEGPPLHPNDARDLWALDENGHLVDIPVHLGVSDGMWTELISGNVHEGQKLVSAIFLPLAPHPAGTQAAPGNPMMPQGSRGGAPGGRGF